MPSREPSACGCPVDAVPEWRRPVLVVSHHGEGCHPLGELLTAFRKAGAEPAVLCLNFGSEPAAGSGTAKGGSPGARVPEPAGCPPDPGAEDVPYRHARVDHELRDGTASASADHNGLPSTIAEAVRWHAADGVVALDLARTPDHPLHRRTANAALEAAAGLGLHALINPCRHGRREPAPRHH
jgi:hypothetical protein